MNIPCTNCAKEGRAKPNNAAGPPKIAMCLYCVVKRLVDLYKMLARRPTRKQVEDFIEPLKARLRRLEEANRVQQVRLERLEGLVNVLPLNKNIQKRVEDLWSQNRNIKPKELCHRLGISYDTANTCLKRARNKFATRGAAA